MGAYIYSPRPISFLLPREPCWRGPLPPCCCHLRLLPRTPLSRHCFLSASPAAASTDALSMGLGSIAGCAGSWGFVSGFAGSGSMLEVGGA